MPRLWPCCPAHTVFLYSSVIVFLLWANWWMNEWTNRHVYIVVSVFIPGSSALCCCLLPVPSCRWNMVCIKTYNYIYCMLPRAGRDRWQCGVTCRRLNCPGAPPCAVYGFYWLEDRAMSHVARSVWILAHRRPVVQPPAHLRHSQAAAICHCSLARRVMQPIDIMRWRRNIWVRSPVAGALCRSETPVSRYSVCIGLSLVW